MEELEFDRTRPADLRNAPRGNGTPPSNCHHSDAAKELATRAASHHGCRCCYCPCWCWCRWQNCQLPSVGHALRRERRAAPRHAAQARQLVSWCCMPVPWPWRAVSSIRWSPRDSGEQSQQQPVSSREGPPRTGSRRRARAPPARCAALSARCAGRPSEGDGFILGRGSRSRGRPGQGRDLRDRSGRSIAIGSDPRISNHAGPLRFHDWLPLRLSGHRSPARERAHGCGEQTVPVVARLNSWSALPAARCAGRRKLRSSSSSHTLIITVS